jgi:hypothetical protein
MVFGRCRPGPSRSSRLFRRPKPKPRNDGPRDLGLSFKALAKALDSPLSDPPLMGFVVCPSADMPSARQLREAEASVGPTVPPASRVPPSWFCTTSTVCSAQRVAGLLHPAASQGFAAFRVCRLQRRPRATRGGLNSPRDAVHTLRRVSLVSSRTASLRPLPSWRYCPPLDCGEWPKPLSALDRARPKPVAKPTRLAPEGDSCVGCGADLQCGDAPIRRSGPPRHRSAAASDRPKPNAVGAHNRARRAMPKQRVARARSSHQQGRAWARQLRRSLGTAGHPRVVVRPPRDRSRELLRCTPSVPPRWVRREGSSKSAKRPPSRLCSANESVVSCRRCQRDDTRSFHGLCTPPRSLKSRSSPVMPFRRLPPPNRGPRRLSGLRPTRRAALAWGHWDPFENSPAPVRGRSRWPERRSEGPKPNPRGPPFQRRSRILEARDGEPSTEVDWATKQCLRSLSKK